MNISNTEKPDETGTTFIPKSNDADVKWNTNMGVTLVDNSNNPTGAKQSPATILLHELDHIRDRLVNPSFAKDANTNTGDDYQNVADKRTIQGVETSFAKFSKEGTRTNHYIGKFYKVVSSTSTREVLKDNYNVQGTEIQIP